MRVRVPDQHGVADDLGAARARARPSAPRERGRPSASWAERAKRRGTVRCRAPNLSETDVREPADAPVDVHPGRAVRARHTASDRLNEVRARAHHDPARRLPRLRRHRARPRRTPHWWPRFTSPLRSTAVTARVGRVLGIASAICFVTGLLSHYQYHPWSWLPEPASPVWLYRVTQGLHVATGIATIPLLLVKLWSVYPKLFQLAAGQARCKHAAERAVDRASSCRRRSSS